MSFLVASPSSSSRVVTQSVSRLSVRARSTSTMGVSQKAIRAERRPKTMPLKRGDIEKAWYFDYSSKLPVLKDGRLDTQSLSSLVDLYHSSATFITKENLDAVIDVEFAPVSGTPQTRPQMASLIDLHLEMNDPGFYSRPENDWRRIAEESAAASSMTPTTTTSAAAGVNPAFSNLAGTSLENALPHRAGSTTTATDLSQRTNDWVGARERELTPRQRLVVQALYGTTADRRPGLEGISERLGQESELEQDERRQFVARQEQILSDVGEETIALKTEPIHLEPWDGPAPPEADAVASEGLAEGGDVAFEEILPKEGEQAKP